MRLTGYPVRFDRRFQLWWYTVSLSRALLRSVPSVRDDTSTSVELLFQGVYAMQLRSVYATLLLREATSAEIEELVDYLDKPPVDPALFIVLGDTLRMGWVICGACFSDENDLGQSNPPALLKDGLWVTPTPPDVENR